MVTEWLAAAAPRSRYSRRPSDCRASGAGGQLLNDVDAIQAVMISGLGRNGHTLECLFQAPLLRPSSLNPGGIDQARPGTRNVPVSSSETGPGDRGPGGDFGDSKSVRQRACSSQNSKPPGHGGECPACACQRLHQSGYGPPPRSGGLECCESSWPVPCQRLHQPRTAVCSRRRGRPKPAGAGPLTHGIAERAPALAALAPFLSAPLRLCSPEAWPPLPGAAAVDAAERSVLAAS